MPTTPTFLILFFGRPGRVLSCWQGEALDMSVKNRNQSVFVNQSGQLITSSFQCFVYSWDSRHGRHSRVVYWVKHCSRVKSFFLFVKFSSAATSWKNSGHLNKEYTLCLLLAPPILFAWLGISTHNNFSTSPNVIKLSGETGVLVSRARLMKLLSNSVSGNFFQVYPQP